MAMIQGELMTWMFTHQINENIYKNIVCMKEVKCGIVFQVLWKIPQI